MVSIVLWCKLNRKPSGFAPVDGGRLYYEVWGSGYPVILIHSGLVDSRMWDDQMSTLAARFTVVRYDLRGFGKSDIPTTAYSQVDDLSRLLQYLKIERAALVGVSYGSYIALDFTLANPSKVTALVAASPNVSGFGGWSSDMRAMWTKVESALQTGEVGQAQELELSKWVPSGVYPESDARIHQLAQENQTTYLVDSNLEEEPKRPAFDRLAEIRAPTLVLIAEHDLPEISIIADRILGKVAGSKKVVIASADHLLNMRNPEAFNRVVLDFLQEHCRQ
jgi:3-oxoadipate enol-lactonase